MKFSTQSLAFVTIFLFTIGSEFETALAAVPSKYASVSSLQDAIVSQNKKLKLNFEKFKKNCFLQLYLVRFGYLKDLAEVGSLLTPSTDMRELLKPNNPAKTALKLAMTKFQQYAKLPQTGEFDETTKAKMNSVRCGNKDILPSFLQVRRRKRYTISGRKWQKRELIYHISDFSQSGFPSSTTEREIETAFELWSNNTNLNFIRSSSTRDADILMKFARLEHGDAEPFDGRGIVLAHAYHPGPDIGGDVHFDDDENWTSRNPSGTNFLHVVSFTGYIGL